jgi:hypothetical protein
MALWWNPTQLLPLLVGGWRLPPYNCLIKIFRKMVTVKEITKGTAKLENGEQLNYEIVTFVSDKRVITGNSISYPTCKTLLKESAIGSFTEGEVYKDLQIVKDEEHEWTNTDGEVIKGRWVIAEA